MRIVMPDGRCSCCLARIEFTGGCALCNSSVTMCAGCGAIIRCGCGKTLEHTRCPAFVAAAPIVRDQRD
jgi:hypothetical protein